MNLILSLAVAAPPEPGKVTIDFGVIDWGWYSILLFAFFVIMAVVSKGKSEWARNGAIAMLVFAVLYAAFVMFAMPFLKSL
ncbi:MAG TPA: hypothetical protein VFH06_02680 [Candidatus Saccharimonadales bacterium]|nr:hypothetical protein [Candidatus Saccharimonadales bacterium]